MNIDRDFDKRKLIKSISTWFIQILVVIILAFVIISYCIQTMKVVGGSMSPVLSNGDVVYVNKLVYKFTAPKRYDIIALKVTKGDSEYYTIKRIIALPGETVQIKDGEIYINDSKREDVPFEDLILTPGMAEEPITLGDDEYFVMGDNCNNSDDSRFSNISNVNKEDILGKISFIVLPKENRGFIKK